MRDPLLKRGPLQRGEQVPLPSGSGRQPLRGGAAGRRLHVPRRVLRRRSHLPPRPLCGRRVCVRAWLEGALVSSVYGIIRRVR
ncbi:hypothetical protein B5X24_HaOG210588 [Helicoverpa armigera]|uniref:Uncharacterized protein n=1 Tax=Helicoverpa armigera TaxID=29058 RepID=A0A2W1BM65_HELAM|nr:hypothetical protein B5X24_HaOG210588 [Helicoverpa armigera]